MQHVLDNQIRTLQAQESASRERKLQIQQLEQQIASERQMLAGTKQKLERVEQNFALMYSRISTIQQDNSGPSATDAYVGRQANIEATVANEKADKAFVKEIIQLQSQIAQLSADYHSSKVEETSNRIQAELSDMQAQLETITGKCATAEKEYQDRQAECKSLEATLQATNKWLQTETVANTQVANKADAKLHSTMQFEAEQEANVANEQRLIESLEKDIGLQEKRSKHNSDGTIG